MKTDLKAYSQLNNQHGIGSPRNIYNPRRRTSGTVPQSPASSFPATGRNGGESFVLLTDSVISKARISSNGGDTMTGNIGNYEAIMRDATSDESRGFDEKDSISGESGDGDRYALSNRFKTSEKIYDIVTSNSDIDQPICSECIDLLLEGLKQQYVEIVRDRDIYAEFLKHVKEDKPSDEQRIAAEKELAEIITQQDQAMSDLRKAELEREQVEKEIAELEQQSRLLDDEEEKFWVTRNKYAQELEDFLEERDMIKMKLKRDTEMLEKLRKTNVYSDIFAIEGGSAAVDRMAGVSGKR